MMNNPIAKQKYIDLQQKFEVELSKLQNQQNKSARNTNVTIVIPVAVHFPNVATNSTDKACLRQLVQNQIDILNADFNATNSDISLWTPTVSAIYPGTNIGSLNVQFVLATQNHPAGTGLANGQKAVTFGTNFLANADNDNQWIGYINIVVREAGALGYSPLGGSPNDGATVVINYDAFGSGNGCAGYAPSGSYNLGRTLAHELGHFFNLDHTFGTDQCLPSNTDEVIDTPQCKGSGGCPEIGSVAGCVAGEKSLTMNYMDYTDDACMYMFTAGQATRMRAYYNAISSQLFTNVLSNDSFQFKDFALFPNPNNGSFKISFKPETIGEIEIIVYDMSGRNVYNKSFQYSEMFDQELQINTLSSGVYFVNIQNGAKKIIKRIIVE
ncbi:zinc-dependent metalloprotease [Flavobacterium sp.]|uniref:zinc-dependent metalloprotease n=1 Tax=Flavobacterium sp. TaxID=239 RepID=UPI00286BD9AE|nr:zinc-dependent metalloprotease [Flavobacterium sp.]